MSTTSSFAQLSVIRVPRRLQVESSRHCPETPSLFPSCRCYRGTVVSAPGRVRELILNPTLLFPIHFFRPAVRQYHKV